MSIRYIYYAIRADEIFDPQVQIRSLVRSVPLDRALSAVLPVGSDTDPCSGIFDMSDSAVELALRRASPIFGELVKRRIRDHRARTLSSVTSKATHEGKFIFSLVGGNMEDFKAGVTGRVGEPRDDMEKGTIVVSLRSIAQTNFFAEILAPSDNSSPLSQVWR